MSRRGENIRKRNDGRWEGRYPVYDLVRDRRVMKSVYAKSYTEVKNKLLKAKNEAGQQRSKVKNNAIALSDVSFNAAAYEWLENIRQKRKWSTYIKYKGIFEKYILQYMCGMTLENIMDNSVNTVFRRMYAQHRGDVSEGVLGSATSIFNRIMAYASEQYGVKYIKEKNENAAREQARIEVFTADEQAKLIKTMYSGMDCNNLGIYICLSTGMRLGEICALRWEDIDMDRRTIKIARTVQRISVEGSAGKTALVTDLPKTFCSKREIPISDELFRLLKDINKKQGYILNGDKPLEPRTYEYRFERLLAKAGISHRKFHILRHTFATNCVVNGVDIKALSELLGHSDVKITLNRYVHPTLDIKRDYINSIADIYGRYRGQMTALRE